MDEVRGGTVDNRTEEEREWDDRMRALVIRWQGRGAKLVSSGVYGEALVRVEDAHGNILEQIRRSGEVSNG